MASPNKMILQFSISPIAKIPVANLIDSITEFFPKGESSQIINIDVISIYLPGPKNTTLSDFAINSERPPKPSIHALLINSDLFNPVILTHVLQAAIFALYFSLNS